MPVPSFGQPNPDLLIVGLAPGTHGANATGRPFTGDHAGQLLYSTLYDFGFSNKREAVSVGDGLTLRKCRIANAVKCLPPGNKPTLEEIKNCNNYLRTEIVSLKPGAVMIALGKIAHDAVLRALNLRVGRYKFAHGAEHDLENQKLILFDSYHCSRYNTQTKRLTTEMFTDVFVKAKNNIRVA